MLRMRGVKKFRADGADVRRRVGGENLPQIAQIDVDGRWRVKGLRRF